ncbi:MAG: hypothetical protein ACR2FY_16735 [Pirellulaceae bacterium]
MHAHLDEKPAMEEDIPRERENFLMWILSALGWRYILILPASAILSFVLVALLLAKGKGSHLGAAMGFIVAIPFLIGLCALLEHLIAGYMVLAESPSTPKYSELARGIGTSLVSPLAALFLMVPSYLLATVGLTIRALREDSKG